MKKAISYIRQGRPDSDDGIDTAGRQHARCRVALKAVDDGVITLHDPHDVAARLLPAEELSVVWPGNDKLAVTDGRKINGLKLH